MAHGRPITFIEDVAERPGMGSCPKEYRDIINLLIDEQGWRFSAGQAGKKHKFYPPDRRHRFVSVPNTPSSYGSYLGFVATLRRRGAEIDENGNSTRVVERDAHGSYTVKMPVIDPNVKPISTIGKRWWAPESEPEPEPEPAPVIPIRAPGPDHDAKGDHYSLGQARTLLRQGYHVAKVVKQTGWGRNWFSDMIDETGYIRL